MTPYRTTHFAPDAPYQYVSPQAKRFIVWLVVALHVCVLVIPGLIFAFVSWLKPDMVLVSKVVLVDSLPNDNTIPSRNPGENPEPNQDDVALPPDLQDIPKIQEVSPPEPKPQPKPQPKPKPEPKPQPKPEPKPQPKPKPEKKVPAKPEKVQPKKETTWRALDAKDIKIQRNPNSKNKKVTKNNSSSLSKLAGKIRADAKAPGGAGGPKGQYSKDANDYYARVGAFLRNKWVDQPDVSALGGSRPFVLVTFHITMEGRVLSTQIVQKSGVAVMDESVKRFLRTLTKIPPPPNKNMTRFTVRMRIED